jgi:hypothetical protein
LVYWSGSVTCIGLINAKRAAGSWGCDVEVVVVDVHAFENR